MTETRLIDLVPFSEGDSSGVSELVYEAPLFVVRDVWLSGTMEGVSKVQRDAKNPLFSTRYWLATTGRAIPLSEMQAARLRRGAA